MSILVEYYGAGGISTTPTLQQVLTAGSTLTQNNTIDVTNYNLIFDGNGSGVVRFNGVTIGGYGNVNIKDTGNSTALISIADTYQTFGNTTLSEYMELNSLTNVSLLSGQNIELQTDSLRLLEITPGSLISATASGSSGDHLIIRIAGNSYKIALLNP